MRPDQHDRRCCLFFSPFLFFHLCLSVTDLFARDSRHGPFYSRRGQVPLVGLHPFFLGTSVFGATAEPTSTLRNRFERNKTLSEIEDVAKKTATMFFFIFVGRPRVARPRRRRRRTTQQACRLGACEAEPASGKKGGWHGQC
ncbi:hypothetical protein TW95_gp1253 [Pandoravirus inopinatum]|uniref:Uncharacterized protein n=1 Tax=Pandoravirus inopinatum TaxID=1605721 RepID=A0A0B5JDZ8_9VIRU|nr:hypothetical protein TW95_gp1253 [Pandoravirus inopinatum]AJF97987.1 hypothetical protein [Pandoravirus inopinatum]